MADQAEGASDTSSKPLTQLPQELLARIPNEIIDRVCLQLEDVPTLRTLRQVDSSFNTAATKAMFSHLDISLDVRSLMKLEFIAFSPLARLVQSVRIRAPRKVSNIGPDNDDGNDYFDDYYYDDEMYGYIRTNFAFDSVGEISTSLARSLRQLYSVQIFEFAIEPIVKQMDDSWDTDLRGAVFEALQKSLPPKLRHAVLRFRNKNEAREVYDIHNNAIRRILATVSDVDILIKVFQEDERYPESDKGGFWKALADNGTRLKQLKLRHCGRPWVVEKGLTYGFENLRFLELASVEFDNSDFFKALGNTSTALETVKLNRIRLSNGELSEIFQALAASKSIIQLELCEFLNESEWHMHQRLMSKYDLDEDLGPWLKKLPKVWNMVCSSSNHDLWACRDLLLAINENRRKAGLEPAFRAAADGSQVKKQSDWLLMPGPDEEDAEERELSFWEEGSGNWAEDLRGVWGSYPIVTSRKDLMYRM